ncbi:MAG TPA: His/Gly/Thr/Pro-type tRNA ligase C-terminal domain-containing protein, partial [Gammaproteobacteria bacterium]|nr:His/Gly/Thr/Pro-type tRNA ligase C-terminal domain-containing protein [Gammaproteobacteria bacterium]
TISKSQKDYAQSIYKKLKNNGFRVEIDLRNEKIGSKIRDHTLKRIPYLIIVGDQEVKNNKISVRTQKGDDLGNLDCDDFINKLSKEILDKSN